MYPKTESKRYGKKAIYKIALLMLYPCPELSDTDLHITHCPKLSVASKMNQPIIHKNFFIITL